MEREYELGATLSESVFEIYTWRLLAEIILWHNFWYANKYLLNRKLYMCSALADISS